MAAPSADFEAQDFSDLRVCSLAARGLWSDMRHLMRQSPRFGYLYQGGKPLTLRQLALATGCPTDEARPLLQELIEAGVCANEANVGYYSPRMVAYESFRAKCSQGGKKGGGNPKLQIPLKGLNATFKGSPKGTPKGCPPDPSPSPSPSLSPPTTPSLTSPSPSPDPGDSPGAGAPGPLDDSGIRMMPTRRKLASTSSQADVVEHFRAGWKLKYGRDYYARTPDFVAAATVVKACGGAVEDAKEAIDRYLADPWPTANLHPLPTMTSASLLNKYLGPIHAGVTNVRSNHRTAAARGEYATALPTGSRKLGA